MAKATPPSVSGSRVAVFVDYENVYYHDKKQYGPDGLRRLVADLVEVAGQCGPVTMAEAVTPFAETPWASDAFLEAGFEPVASQGGRIKDAADLRMVSRMMALDERSQIGFVFLVSGDKFMVGSVRQAQLRGLSVVVVACEQALSGRLRVTADKVLSMKDVQTEAARLRRKEPPALGLMEWAAARSAAAAVGPASVRAAATPTPAAPVPVPPPERHVFTSPSALKLYLQCPQRYYRVHVEGLPDKQNVAGFTGTVVHETLRGFFGLEPAARTWEAMEATLRKAWAASPERRKVFGSQEEERMAGLEVLVELKEFFRLADRKVRPFAREVFLKTELAEGLTLRGKVDRIDGKPGEAFTIAALRPGIPQRAVTARLGGRSRSCRRRASSSRPDSQRSWTAQHSSGAMFAVARVPPAPPRASVARKKPAEPAKTRKDGGTRRMISAIWAMSPPLSLTPVMLGWRASRATRAGERLSPVLRGML